MVKRCICRLCLLWHKTAPYLVHIVNHGDHPGHPFF